ncbi:MAG TPA: hypothetical protein DCX13_13825, partial [Rhodobacteraceae bacterium]|nr:hypothetical protein [Paracoccaceae bacterium]
MTSLNTPHVPRKAHPRLIRSALAIGGFLGLTGILVALQPDRDPLAYPAPDVTRAVTDLSAPVASAEAAAPVQVAAAAPIQALQPAPIAK